MAPKYEAVRTLEAPLGLPQFSQAVKYNGMVYCSGSIGALPGAEIVLLEGTVKDRTVRLFVCSLDNGFSASLACSANGIAKYPLLYNHSIAQAHLHDG